MHTNGELYIHIDYTEYSSTVISLNIEKFMYISLYIQETFWNVVDYSVMEMSQIKFIDPSDSGKTNEFWYDSWAARIPLKLTP